MSYLEEEIVRKFILATGLIAALVLSSVAGAKSDHSRGKKKADASASPSVDPSISPDPSASASPTPHPGDDPPGRACRRHSKKKARGDCPEKKDKSASPSPSPSPTPSPSSAPLTMESATKRGSDARDCGKRKSRKARKRCRKSSSGGAPTPVDPATSTAMQATTE